MHSSVISASRRASDSIRARCFTGRTKLPWPVTMRNCVASERRLEPEMSSASLGAGTCQNNMVDSFSSLGKWGDEDRAGRQRFDDRDPRVAGDWLIGPGGERLAGAANGEQYLAGAVCRNGDCNPPDLAEEALFRVHGHVHRLSHLKRQYRYTPGDWGSKRGPLF